MAPDEPDPLPFPGFPTPRDNYGWQREGELGLRTATWRLAGVSSRRRPGPDLEHASAGNTRTRGSGE